LDMAKFLAMKTANIGDLKKNLSKFISFVEQGEVIEICKHSNSFLHPNRECYGQSVLPK